MLREACRQKGLRGGSVPPVCILDPDGDIVDHVCKIRGATRSLDWACYHTKLWEWDAGGIRCGVVGHAVGASFSVLVAEQLFASGCELLVSVASAGQIKDLGPPPYHILVERALRDEGTSYHYLPPAAWVDANPDLVALARQAFRLIAADHPHRRHLDHGCAVPRDRNGDRRAAEGRHHRRRDGGRGALRLRRSLRQAGHLPGAL